MPDIEASASFWEETKGGNDNGYLDPTMFILKDAMIWARLSQHGPAQVKTQVGSRLGYDAQSNLVRSVKVILN
ncbi:hypothetical protein Ancab_038571 [Ancistrocladus abbreviatus]